MGITPAAHVVCYLFDDSALLLSGIDDEAFTAADSISASAVKLISAGTNGPALTTFLTEVFDLSVDEAAKTLHDLLAVLYAKKLIVLADPEVDLIVRKAKFMPDKFHINPDVQIREEDESGALLFDPDTNAVSVINDTGQFIWNACATGRTLAEILSLVKESFEGFDEESIEDDVQGYLNSLLAQGLIGVE